MQKKRLIWADLIRILAIYLVVVVHSTLFPTTLTSVSDVVRIGTFNLAASCVPLFVMLSGALLLGKKETYGTFISKRAVRLLVPWLTWTVIYFLAHFHVQSTVGLAKQFLTTFESFWFLPMILGLYCLTPALRIFVGAAKKRDIWLIIFFWFCVVSLLPYTRNSLAFPRQVDDGMLRQVIHYLGYYLLGYQLVNCNFFRRKWLAMGAILIGATWSVIGTLLISASSNVLIGDFYRYIAPGVVVTAVGIFTFLLHQQDFFTKHIPGWATRKIALLSQGALAIYFIHPFVQQLFTNWWGRADLMTNAPFDNYLNGLLVFCGSVGVFLVLNQIPGIRKVIS